MQRCLLARAPVATKSTTELSFHSSECSFCALANFRVIYFKLSSSYTTHAFHLSHTIIFPSHSYTSLAAQNEKMGSQWFVGLVANLKFSSKCSSTLSLYCCVFASDKYIFATYHLFWSVPDQKSTIYCPESILLFWFERVFSSSGCLISFMDGFSCSTSVEGVNYKVVVETFTFYYTYIFSSKRSSVFLS